MELKTSKEGKGKTKYKEHGMYNYRTERGALFTEDGQKDFLRIRDNVEGLLKKAGAFKLTAAWEGVTGNSWFMMACVDRLVEIGEIKELTGNNVQGQDRVFTR